MKLQRIIGVVLLIALIGVLGNKFWREMNQRTDGDIMFLVSIVILSGTIYLVSRVLREG